VYQIQAVCGAAGYHWQQRLQAKAKHRSTAIRHQGAGRQQPLLLLLLPLLLVVLKPASVLSRMSVLQAHLPDPAQLS
jgi:hypothetical protein